MRRFIDSSLGFTFVEILLALGMAALLIVVTTSASTNMFAMGSRVASEARILALQIELSNIINDETSCRKVIGGPDPVTAAIPASAPAFNANADIDLLRLTNPVSGQPMLAPGMKIGRYVANRITLYRILPNVVVTSDPPTFPIIGGLRNLVVEFQELDSTGTPMVDGAGNPILRKTIPIAMTVGVRSSPATTPTQQIVTCMSPAPSLLNNPIAVGPPPSNKISYPLPQCGKKESLISNGTAIRCATFYCPSQPNGHPSSFCSDPTKMGPAPSGTYGEAKDSTGNCCRTFFPLDPTGVPSNCCP